MGRAVQDIQRVAAYGLVQTRRAGSSGPVDQPHARPAPGRSPAAGSSTASIPQMQWSVSSTRRPGCADAWSKSSTSTRMFRESLIDQEVLERYHAVRILYRVEVEQGRAIARRRCRRQQRLAHLASGYRPRQLRFTPIAQLARQYLFG